MDDGYVAPVPKNPVPHERQQEIAALLSEVDGEQLDHVLKVLKEDPSMADAEGTEMELDFDVLSPMTISKLDRYFRRVRPEGSRLDNVEESSGDESSDED